MNQRPRPHDIQAGARCRDARGLRLLTNSKTDSPSPFAGILVGQPMLARSLRMGVFAALDQRIATRFALWLMDPGESVNYLRHHLALAAGPTPSSRMMPSPDCTGWPTAYPGP